MLSNDLNIADRVAVVIGATSGIGRALAIGLAQQGAHVVPTGRRAHQLEAVCQEIEGLGVGTLCRTADITDTPSVEALRDAVLQQFGRVDILVNAAGYTFKQATVAVSLAQWSCLMQTNLDGAL